MIRRLAPLFVLLIIGTGLLAASGSKSTVTAVPLTLRPRLPSGTFVARIYYNSLDELNTLTAYDLWEYNNLDQSYILLSLDALEYSTLEKQGWRLQIDHEQTAQLTIANSPFATGYRTVEEIYYDLGRINTRYPDLTELVTYGQSTCLAQGGCTTLGGEALPGFDLLAFRISNEDIAGVSTVASDSMRRGSKPVFFLLANIHAREIAVPEIAMDFINALLSGYGQDASITSIVDWHEIWVIPLANPDAHWLVELGANPNYDQGAFYQRKNANLDVDDDGTPDCSVWPPQVGLQYGVDLNRNHSYAWGTGGSSADPCSQTFRGPAAASELETSALQDLVSALIADQRNQQEAAPQSTSGLLITMHSFGDLVLWPWGNDDQPSPNYHGLKAIGDMLASFNGYESCQASTCLYHTSGTTDDWAYGELGIPAFTYEIGQTFMPEYDDIRQSLSPLNLPSLLYAAHVARMPYETILGPDVHGLQAQLSNEGLVELTAAIDDRQHGGQNITAASLSIRLPHWAEGAEPIPLSPTDGRFDSPVEQVAAVLDPVELGSGRHLLYVNGMDSEGHWGIMGELFLDLPSGTIPRLYIPFNITSN